MEAEPSAPTRKVRFAPKIPTRKAPKSTIPKTEVVDESEAAAKELLRRVNENAGRGRAKAERKSETVQVAFGHGSSSSSIRSYGKPRRGGANGLGQIKEEEYKEPWDYYSDYPVRLPLRRPFLGNPELLDEEEFGDERANMEYNENSINSAEELGLLEENTEEKMLFLQLPASLPWVKQSVTGETNEADGSQKLSKPVGRLGKGCSLEELPAGFMGKLLVYQSGAVKLKIGETLYNVSSGTNSVFVNDGVVINSEAKQFCAVGELKRAIVTPDVDSLLRTFSDENLLEIVEIFGPRLVLYHTIKFYLGLMLASISSSVREVDVCSLVTYYGPLFMTNINIPLLGAPSAA